MKKKFFAFLEWLGLRCSQCGGSESTIHTERELKWGTNIGDILFEDPYYAKYQCRTCRSCGHEMSRLFVGAEDVETVYPSLGD